ncbi:hypothetical protein [Actinomadura alba]|uniref:Uncharacterized protein n=1 Tax=Actinomadura alba TaxID=406431 RepID=A0ABR7LSJ4_9ACTN|nr:hypothetical protein [Actinomadura alba]MBC6467766.1 hypothetical protein [Actinomadura alba]
MAVEVPNPKYEELERLLRKLKRDADLVERALDKPQRRMRSRQVWVSDGNGTAARFEQDLTYQRGQLRKSIRALIAAVEETLKQTPKKIPIEQAMTTPGR